MKKYPLLRHEFRRWLPVPGFEGRYSVSNLGEVWSDKDQVVLKQRLCNHKTYWRVALFTGLGYKTLPVHLIVLMAFAGDRPPGMVARHLDDVKEHNQIWNLRWGTRKQNYQDRDRNGKTVKGNRHHNAKLTEKIVRRIKQKLSSAGPGDRSALAKRYGVTQTTIWQIEIGRLWRHVKI